MYLQVESKVLSAESGSISLGGVTLTLMKSRRGAPCLLLSHPGDAERRGYWYTEDWLAIKAAMPQVQALLRSPHQERVEVAVDDWRRIIFTTRDGSSVIIRVEVECLVHSTLTNFGTRLTQEDWEALLSKEQDIDGLLCLAGPTEPRTRGIKRKRVEGGQRAVKYRKQCVTYYTCTAHTKREKTQYFLDRHDCAAEALVLMKRCGPSVQVDIEEHTLNVYNDMTMMRHLYAWFLIRKIDEMKRRVCSGCHDDEGNQEAHMDGCLMDFGEAMDEFIECAPYEIPVFQMAGVYCEFLKMLNVTPSSNLIAVSQCAKVYLQMDEELESYVTGDGDFCSTILDVLFKKCLQRYVESGV